MRFEAAKKTLATALSDVKAITDSVGMPNGDDTTPIRLRISKKTLKVSTLYAEAAVKDVTIEEEGEAICDMQSLQQALAVSGDKFYFDLIKGNSSASFKCGRSKGPVTLRDDEFYDTLLKDAPKATVHVPGLKGLLSSLIMKAPGGVSTDRSLHFEPKTKTLRGESSDTSRAILVSASIDSETDIEAVSLSLPPKVCDVLGPLVADSKVGFDDGFFSVVTPGLRAVVPLLSEAPLELKGQVEEWLEEQFLFGTITVQTKEIKSAISDAQSMVGKNIQASLDIQLPEKGTAAKIVGTSEGGEIEADLVLDAADLVAGVSLSVPAPYLQECLNLYKGEVIVISVYSGALVISPAEKRDWISSHITSIPLNEAAPVPAALKMKADLVEEDPAAKAEEADDDEEEYDDEDDEE